MSGLNCRYVHIEIEKKTTEDVDVVALMAQVAPRSIPDYTPDDGDYPQVDLAWPHSFPSDAHEVGARQPGRVHSAHNSYPHLGWAVEPLGACTNAP